MSDSLKNFAHWNSVDKLVIDGVEVNPTFDGETCWERNHPTFISKKRKVILTCPRKVGHSSIRFYLNSQNEMHDDDWVWIEDHNRNPKTWLEQDEYRNLVESVYKQDNRKIILPKSQKDNQNNPYLKNAEIFYRDDDKFNSFFGDYNCWDFGAECVPSLYTERQEECTPPFQTLPLFKDWTTYLLVRDPFDRFISGLITEMDNGINSPWKYERNTSTEETWENFYNSAKRMLYFVEPEYLLLGGLNGQQMNHTFILSRPLWDGKSMYDVYDNLIHYKHDIDYTMTKDGLMVNQESIKETTGVIDSLIELGFIDEEVKIRHHENDWQNSYSHTHMNITPHIRQHVINELQEDEDLKEWWDRCREIINWDYESLKNNQQKF